MEILKQGGDPRRIVPIALALQGVMLLEKDNFFTPNIYDWIGTSGYELCLSYSFKMIPCVRKLSVLCIVR